jgi:hypothetical protein
MSLPDPNHVSPPPGAPSAHPLRDAAVVIYATLLLLGLAIPRGLVNWAREMQPGARQQAVLATAQAIEAFSHSSQIDEPYRLAREYFLEATGKRED